MARRRNRTRKRRADGTNNQAVALNSRAYMKNLALLTSLALSRFRVTGLPESCDERFLLWCLLRYGYATICHPDGMPDLWQTLQAVPTNEYNAYGIPTGWQAQGADGKTVYQVNENNGVLIYYSRSTAQPFTVGATMASPWNALDLFAQRLAKFERTEDANLTHQFTPWLLIAPPEKELELANLFNAIMSGQPAVFGSDALYEMAEKITAISTQTPLLAEELGRGWMNAFHQAMMWLGIPHLAFEKGERMIEDEARANTAPTSLALLDCLNGMRDGFDKLNRRFGLDVNVYFNEDLESLNFNYLNNAEALAQDNTSEGGITE